MFGTHDSKFMEKSPLIIAGSQTNSAKVEEAYETGVGTQLN
jgi:hypothetical protein